MLFQLRRLGQSQILHSHLHWLFVVHAPDEHAARVAVGLYLRKMQCSIDEINVWIDPTRSECQEVPLNGNAKVIIAL